MQLHALDSGLTDLAEWCSESLVLGEGVERGERDLHRHSHSTLHYTLYTLPLTLVLALRLAFYKHQYNSAPI